MPQCDLDAGLGEGRGEHHHAVLRGTFARDADVDDASDGVEGYAAGAHSTTHCRRYGVCAHSAETGTDCPCPRTSNHGRNAEGDSGGVARSNSGAHHGRNSRGNCEVHCTGQGAELHTGANRCPHQFYGFVRKLEK